MNFIYSLITSWCTCISKIVCRDCDILFVEYICYILQCFDACLGDRKGIRPVKILNTSNHQSSYLGDLHGTGLAWSDLWKSRLVKQKLKVVVVVYMLQCLSVCSCS